MKKKKQYTQQLQQYQKYSLEKDYYEAENDKWQNIIKQLNEYEEWSQQLETNRNTIQYLSMEII